MNEPHENPFDSIRSDSLASLRRLTGHPLFETLGDIFQIELILDANVVIRDLIWLTRTRSKPEARTILQEVIAAGTVLPSAPKWLDAEIRRKIPEIAENEGIPTEALVRAWADYHATIVFEEDPPIPKGLAVSGIRDPKDLPYVLLQQRTGRLIYTRDDDLEGMDALTVQASVVVHLRDYSRAAAVKLTVASGGLMIGVLTWEMIAAAWDGAKQMVEGFRRLPEWVQVVSVGLLILAIAHPKTRAMMLDFVKSLEPAAKRGADVLLEIAGPLAVEFNSTKQRSADALEAVQAHIPQFNTGG